MRYQDRKAGLGGSVPDPDERDLPEAPDDHDGRDGLSHLPAGPAGGDPASAPVERPTGVSVVAAKSAGAEGGRRVGFRGGGGRDRLDREVILRRLAAKQIYSPTHVLDCFPIWGSGPQRRVAYSTKSISSLIRMAGTGQCIAAQG